MIFQINVATKCVINTGRRFVFHGLVDVTQYGTVLSLTEFRNGWHLTFALADNLYNLRVAQTFDHACQGHTSICTFKFESVTTTTIRCIGSKSAGPDWNLGQLKNASLVVRIDDQAVGGGVKGGPAPFRPTIVPGVNEHGTNSRWRPGSEIPTLYLVLNGLLRFRRSICDLKRLSADGNARNRLNRCRYFTRQGTGQRFHINKGIH